MYNKCYTDLEEEVKCWVRYIMNLQRTPGSVTCGQGGLINLSHIQPGKSNGICSHRVGDVQLLQWLPSKFILQLLILHLELSFLLLHW